MLRVLFMSTVVKLVAINLAITLVLSYENAYDLLEWKQRRLYEPRHFYAPGNFHDSRQRFFTENRNPYLGNTNINQHFSKFGNGYDNIGNGIPSRHFHHIRVTPTDEWLFHRRPIQERIYSNIGFDDYPVHRIQPAYSKYFPNRHFSHHRTGSPKYIVPENEFSLRRNTDYAKTDRFLEDNEKKNQEKNDEIFTRSQEGVNMDSVKKEKSGEHLHTDQTGENKTSSRNNKVVKKGHTTRGFASHHHKDETGNSTTFFDESSDYGGQSDVRDISDLFGTRKTLEQITHKGDEKFFNENGSQQGSYGSGLLLGNQKFKQDLFSSNGENKFGEQFQSEDEDNLHNHKTYQYLNGDGFDFKKPYVHNYF